MMLKQIEEQVDDLIAQRDSALTLCDHQRVEIESLMRELAQAEIRIEELKAELERRGLEAV